MSGTIPPLPQYASMAWWSVKAQVQLYFLQGIHGVVLNSAWGQIFLLQIIIINAL
jgi:hypothetical protein